MIPLNNLRMPADIHALIVSKEITRWHTNVIFEDFVDDELLELKRKTSAKVLKVEKIFKIFLLPESNKWLIAHKIPGK